MDLGRVTNRIDNAASALSKSFSLWYHTMTAVQPESEEAFVFPSGTLTNLAPAGLDLGHKKVKITFVERSPEKDLLHCVMFPADRLIEAVSFLKSKVGTEASLPITGRVEAAAAAVRAAWGKEAVAVTKLDARIVGSHFLIKNVPLEQLELPIAGGKVWEVYGGMMDRFKESMEMAKEQFKSLKKGDEQTDSVFPNLVLHTGHIQTLWLATNENEAQKLAIGMIGGQTLNGLVNLLVGHQSFEQLEATTKQGHVQNIDTVVKEVLSTDPNSPYGHFPEDMPIFPFGKAYDYNKGLSEFAKEDLATSLVRMIAGTSLMDAIGTVIEGALTKIFVGGSVFHLSTARQAWDEYFQSYFSMLGAKTVFVKLQHACAVGAMMADASGHFDKLEVHRA